MKFYNINGITTDTPLENKFHIIELANGELAFSSGDQTYEIVHNASIDSIPKVYQNIQGKDLIEKFILLPDFKNGIIKTYKNRRRFFNDDNKLNEVLPTIIKEFWNRLKFTLSEIK